jgi:hypothetical protein
MTAPEQLKQAVMSLAALNVAVDGLRQAIASTMLPDLHAKILAAGYQGRRSGWYPERPRRRRTGKATR